MALALDQARIAALLGEVPVGAVVIRHGKVIATGRNALVSDHDPTAHAEILALRAAAKILGNYRLDECELFVTLEPCAMCSGAIFNARLKRVVFGAPEPKTGAAGSVVNLFAQNQLNHQTECQGGVLAEASRALIQIFFRERRVEQRESARQRHPLRDDALRTPDATFIDLPGFPWMPRYRSDLPALDRLRMHYLDEQIVSVKRVANAAPITYLCLHDIPGWSYSFRNLIPSLIGAGHRVVAPDMIGFGKSDKPKKKAFHTFKKHRQILVELVETLNLHNIVLVLAEGQSLLGLTLPVAAPLRYKGIRRINAAGDFFDDEQPLSDGFLLWKRSMHHCDDQGLTQSGNINEKRSFNQIDPVCNAPFPSLSYRYGVLDLSFAGLALNDAENLEIFHKTERFWACLFCESRTSQQV